MIQDTRQTLEEFGLINGGDCFSHFHSEDRRATQDFLHGLQSVSYNKSTSSSLVLTGVEDIIRADTSASDITITLPPAVHGKEVTIVKTSALHTLTVQGANGELINGDNVHVYTTIWSARTFKAVDGQWSIVWGFIRDKFPHGSFTSTQTQTVSVINTPTRITFNVTDYHRDMVQVAGDGIHVAQSGLYNVQFSCQLTNTDTQAHDAAIWLRKGSGVGAATDVPYTSSVTSVTGTHGGQPGYHIIAANFFVYLNVDDYIEMWWVTNSLQVSLDALPPITTPFVNPGSPSVVVTLSYVSSETA